MVTFTLDAIHIDDIVVYLKNERTGSSTIRKCKFIGHVLEFEKNKVKIRRLSPPDVMITPDEMKDFGVDTISQDDIVHIIISKYEIDHSLSLPNIIGGITFWNKEELIHWIEERAK